MEAEVTHHPIQYSQLILKVDMLMAEHTAVAMVGIQATAPIAQKETNHRKLATHVLHAMVKAS